MDNKIKVSVICNTYNHERFIRDTLEGFVRQKTDFLYEVLIHDDASTDNTAQIIKEYVMKYPGIIKPIYENENQYSQNPNIIHQIQTKRIKGKYVAICEGDDYWIDSNKLQKQYDFMESNPEFNMCSHNFIVYNVLRSREESRSNFSNSSIKKVSVDETIIGGGGLFATNSLFFKSSIYDEEPNFFSFLNYDYSLQLYGSLKNGIAVLPDYMSVYRFHVPNSWTDKMERSTASSVNFSYKIDKMLDIFNEETKFRYNDSVKYAKLKNEYSRCNYDCNFREMLDKRFKCINMNLSVGEKIKLLLYAIFPKFVNIYRDAR